MANEQKPAFINLTQIFDTHAPNRWYENFLFILPPTPVNGHTAKEVTINVADIKKLEDADQDNLPLSPSTVLTTKDGGSMAVRETRDEIKQKILGGPTL